MRIRKHAKISPLVYAMSPLKSVIYFQTHICQLNQSPWDVMKFSPPSTPPPPPPPPQVDGDGDCAVNGSLSDFISVTQRDQWEYPGDIPAESTTVKAEAPPPPPVTAEKNIICGKTDGKSWQCKKEAAKGNSLCHHHLSQARSYNNGYQYIGKKQEKISAIARRPARTKKASTSSNPYEFYYYSGFGPRWGKRRGEACSNTNSSADTGNDTATVSNNNGRSSKNVEPEDEMGDDESDSDEYEEEEEISNRDNNIGKKRMRKPIKARSLKSLM